MASGRPRLSQIEPRERVGAQTGRKYEYQYERTARAALNLLDDQTKYVCVYCDWHDDYVVEFGANPTRYLFHQVKARKSSQGPWTFKDFFGLAMNARTISKKSPVARMDAIVPLLLLHHKNFGAYCAGLAFVTNSGLEPTLSRFLEAIGASKSEALLPAKVRTTLHHIAHSYSNSTPKTTQKFMPTAIELFSWLHGVKVYTDQGQLEEPNAALLELADIVKDYSEIDLLLSQSKQIAREIVNQIRAKAAHSTTVVPTSDDKLRRDKGIVVASLLKVLSLSSPAYEQLKSGIGQDTVKTLSRLDRYCRKHGMSEFLVEICGFKAQWDVWRTIERHFLRKADYVLLEQKANEILAAGMSIAELVAEAKNIAKQFRDLTATQLTAEHILGLVFSLAAQSEVLGGASSAEVGWIDNGH